MSIYLISGASTGIGRSVCDLLLSKRHQVISIGRTPVQFQKPGLNQIIADFSNPLELERLLVLQKWPEIQSFINCAGATRSKSIREADCKDLQAVFNINVISPMLIIKSILPQLKEDSSIILLGSQSAYKGSFDDAYASSKGAVDSLVKSVSAKVAPKTRVINFSPGITYPTQLTEIMPEQLRNQKKEEIPMKRFATPEEMAEVIFFLTTDSCRFMTGNTIDMNGGLVLR